MSKTVMNKKIICMLFDAKKGDFIQTVFYNNMSRENALICFVEQYSGNYSTWEYPKKLEGIYKSKVIKDRLLYDITEDLIVYAQYA